MKNLEIESVYKTFVKGAKLPKSLGISKLPLPIQYLLTHFVFIAIAHLLAILCWYSYIFHMTIAMMWMEISVYNGACFYMDYFSKRYESQLAKLEKLETVIT